MASSLHPESKISVFKYKPKKLQIPSSGKLKWHSDLRPGQMQNCLCRMFKIYSVNNSKINIVKTNLALKDVPVRDL